MSSFNSDLDTPIWGARALALAVRLVDKRGKPRERAAYHLLASKKLPAEKVGKTYVSTPRRLRSIATGQAT